MTKQLIPKEVNPHKLAKVGASVESEMSVKDFSRLDEYASSDSKVSASIKFNFNSRNQIVLSGKVKATLNATCQNCMKDFPLEVDGSFDLVVVNDDNEQQDDTEIVGLSSKGTVYLRDIVEDEILLGIPVVTTHPEGMC